MKKRQYKYKRSRTLLCNVFNDPKASFNKRPTKPGIHKGKMYSNTYHGELLFHKQRLLAYYCNIKNYQLKTLVQHALTSNDYKSKIIKTLESRLDVILYRSGIVKSMQEARQIINHRKVILDMSEKSNIATSPSVLITSDATIKFASDAHNRLKANQAINTRVVPKHINFDTNDLVMNIQYDYIPNNENGTDLQTISLDNIVAYYRF